MPLFLKMGEVLFDLKSWSGSHDACMIVRVIMV